MRPTIIDTHAHLDMSPFDKDRAEMIARAQDSGVRTIITVGIDLESSQKAIALAEDYPGVVVAVGIHPHDTTGVSEADITNLAELTKHSKVVAIGETGLDFYRDRSPRETQLQVLKWHLELASKLNLPVIIHCRQAEKDMLPLLRDWASDAKHSAASSPGVIHCFSGDVETARQYLDMGFFIALGGYVSYPSSRHMDNVIRFIPADRLLVETDCPFLPPQAHRGKRNEPAYLTLTVKTIAEFRQVSPETIALETTHNACNLFRLPGLE